MAAIRWPESLAQDLRYTARSLRRGPTFTAVAALTLAIGIGATTALFSTVNATLLRPLPYPHDEQLVSVRSRLTSGQVTSGLLSPLNIGVLNDPQLPVQHVAGLSAQPQDGTLVGADGAPVNVLITGVTEGFFEVLGLPMAAGPGFTHDDFVPSGPGAPTALVLSNRVWTTRFGRDPSIVGRSLQIVEMPTGARIAGVAPAEIDLPNGTDFWAAARVDPRGFGHGFDVILRMRPGAKLEGLRDRADVLLTELSRTSPTDVGRQFVMRPLAAAIVGDLGPMLLIVLGATALLLLLACVNVMNLLLARGAVRTRELAVRAALGAARARLVRQLLTESLVLAAAGTLIGVGLAYAGVRLLLVLGASKLPRLTTVSFDLRVLLFAVAALVFSALVMGLAPAWRLASVDARTLLNEGGRSSTPGRRTARSMSALVVAEIALAIVLTAGAGWLVQSFARLGAVNPGYTPERRLVMTVRPGRTFDFRKLDEVYAWSDAVMQRVRDVPGVALAGSAATFPLQPNRDGTVIVGVQGEVWDPNHPTNAHVRDVSVGFFEAMGVRLVAGRLFTNADRRDTRPVAIVNQAFVRMFLGTRSPLSASFAYGLPAPDPKTMRDIVGVVQDVPYESLGEPPLPAFYVVQSQLFPLVRQTVVTAARSGDPRALESGLRLALTAFDPLMMVSFSTAPEIVAATLSRERLGMTLMLIFGVLALVLASIGIYGVIAYASAQRRDEIATRIALGASAGQVFWLVMGTGQRLAIVGVLLGLAGAYAGGRLVVSRVYAMRAADPVILLTAAVIVAAVALLATMIPAIRASRLDPARALRAE
ncbi:MAG TPA: ADOP family duplicated permease [Vicinamibacterales bacterium]|nr:ADOP family duplicated permease [Vicinamibacterales bacterium]